jgi:hypothetical protein
MRRIGRRGLAVVCYISWEPPSARRGCVTARHRRHCSRAAVAEPTAIGAARNAGMEYNVTVDLIFDLCQSRFPGRVDRPATTRGRMPDLEGPALAKGDTWRTSRPGLAREIVALETGPDDIRRIKYRTRAGEFVCSEREFRFWIERRFASPSGTKTDRRE